MIEHQPDNTVAVLGAGIVGTCIAYTLQSRGLAVTLIDRDEPGSGCSYGNSGAISPASVAPLAMPGIVKSLPAMLADPESPLRLRLLYLPRALPWLARFLASARPDRVNEAAARLAALHAGAVERHLVLAREVGVPELILQRGHLYLYPDEQALAKDAAGWRMREQYGFHFDKLDRKGITDLEPGVGSRYGTGIFLRDHATVLNPYAYVQAIARAFVARGGQLLLGQAAAPLPADANTWRVSVNGQSRIYGRVVIAAGAWSAQLLRPMGVRLQLESQRGYHVQFQGAAAAVSRTVVLADRKIFVTPMQEGLRVGGTVEIAGLSYPPDMRRARMLERIARETFQGLQAVAATHWMGHRPCMPDSVPVIGPVAGHPGLWLATGHGHLGLTDSPNTAQRIADDMLAAVPTP
jgi:D-amino-acid dehydrogenase